MSDALAMTIISLQNVKQSELSGTMCPTIINIQLLSEFFVDSDFCHNYLHTPVTLNWLPYS